MCIRRESRGEPGLDFRRAFAGESEPMPEFRRADGGERGGLTCADSIAKRPSPGQSCAELMAGKPMFIWSNGAKVATRSCSLRFEVSDFTKPLFAVRRIVDRGNEVHCMEAEGLIESEGSGGE